MINETTKKKEKPGKVLRIDALTWKYITELKRPKESFSGLIRRLIGLPSRKGITEVSAKFVLPSDLHRSIEEARGAAVLRAVRAKRKETEEPIAVRSVV